MTPRHQHSMMSLVRQSTALSLSTQRLFLQVYFTPVLFRAYCCPREPTSTPVLHMPSSSPSIFKAVFQSQRSFPNQQYTNDIYGSNIMLAPHNFTIPLSSSLPIPTGLWIKIKSLFARQISSKFNSDRLLWKPKIYIWTENHVSFKPYFSGSQYFVLLHWNKLTQLSFTVQNNDFMKNVGWTILSHHALPLPNS